NPGDSTHRFIADWIYALPRLGNMNPLLRHTFGGWEIAGIFSARTGDRLIITESCASNWHCRPDYVGGKTIVDDWQHSGINRCIAGARCSVQYINRPAFVAVPVDPTTRIAIRPGNLGNGAVRGPGSWTTDIALSKNFKVQEHVNLQIRADMFNATN